MSKQDVSAPEVGTDRVAAVLVPLVIGSAVSVALGVYVAGFSSPLTVKVWLASAAMLFALVQLFSALLMYGRLGVKAPQWTGMLHRWSGRIAFLLAVPVAVHCLYALGFQFFGAFTLKMLLLTRRGLAGWVLPVAGGLVFAVLTGIWLTSSVWFFSTSGFTF